jgi:apolipoprotein N-acyltransferase
MTSAPVDAPSVLPTRSGRELGLAIGASLLAAVLFQGAFEFPALNFLVLPFAYLLISLARAGSARVAFRLGFLTGLLIFAPQLAWFWRIFGFAAVCLWAVLSFFTGLFVLGLHLWCARFGTRLVWIAAPVLWAGLEFFRSELYFLRFSWLSVGYVFSGRAGVLPVGILGVYGCGFMVFLLAGVAVGRKRQHAFAYLLGASILLATATSITPKPNSARAGTEVHVAGMQLEFPPELKVPGYLDDLLKAFPKADVLILSEYTFDGTIPKRVRDWCRAHHKYLIAGGKADVAEGKFYNTAFVVGPDGEILFEQAKSVPIQFFKDGLPAPAQKIWNSPWGKIAMCVCYDMSYRRVMDEFMRHGAGADRALHGCDGLGRAPT